MGLTFLKSLFYVFFSSHVARPYLKSTERVAQPSTHKPFPFRIISL